MNKPKKGTFLLTRDRIRGTNPGYYTLFLTGADLRCLGGDIWASGYEYRVGRIMPRDLPGMFLDPGAGPVEVDLVLAREMSPKPSSPSEPTLNTPGPSENNPK